MFALYLHLEVGHIAPAHGEHVSADIGESEVLPADPVRLLGASGGAALEVVVQRADLHIVHIQIDHVGSIISDLVAQFILVLHRAIDPIVRQTDAVVAVIGAVPLTEGDELTGVPPVEIGSVHPLVAHGGGEEHSTVAVVHPVALGLPCDAPGLVMHQHHLLMELILDTGEGTPGNGAGKHSQSVLLEGIVLQAHEGIPCPVDLPTVVLGLFHRLFPVLEDLDILDGAILQGMGGSAHVIEEEVLTGNVDRADALVGGAGTDHLRLIHGAHIYAVHIQPDHITGAGGLIDEAIGMDLRPDLRTDTGAQPLSDGSPADAGIVVTHAVPIAKEHTALVHMDIGIAGGRAVHRIAEQEDAASEGATAAPELQLPGLIMLQQHRLGHEILDRVHGPGGIGAGLKGHIVEGDPRPIATDEGIALGVPIVVIFLVCRGSDRHRASDLRDIHALPADAAPRDLYGLTGHRIGHGDAQPDVLIRLIGLQIDLERLPCHRLPGQTHRHEAFRQIIADLMICTGLLPLLAMLQDLRYQAGSDPVHAFAPRMDVVAVVIVLHRLVIHQTGVFIQVHQIDLLALSLVVFHEIADAVIEIIHGRQTSGAHGGQPNGGQHTVNFRIWISRQHPGDHDVVGLHRGSGRGEIIDAGIQRAALAGSVDIGLGATVGGIAVGHVVGAHIYRDDVGLGAAHVEIDTAILVGRRTVLGGIALGRIVHDVAAGPGDVHQQIHPQGIHCLLPPGLIPGDITELGVTAMSGITIVCTERRL